MCGEEGTQRPLSQAPLSPPPSHSALSHNSPRYLCRGGRSSWKRNIKENSPLVSLLLHLYLLLHLLLPSVPHSPSRPSHSLTHSPWGAEAGPEGGARDAGTPIETGVWGTRGRPTLAHLLPRHSRVPHGNLDTVHLQPEQTK